MRPSLIEHPLRRLKGRNLDKAGSAWRRTPVFIDLLLLPYKLEKPLSATWVTIENQALSVIVYLHTMCESVTLPLKISTLNGWRFFAMGGATAGINDVLLVLQYPPKSNVENPYMVVSMYYLHWYLTLASGIPTSKWGFFCGWISNPTMTFIRPPIKFSVAVQFRQPFQSFSISKLSRGFAFGFKTTVA